MSNCPVCGAMVFGQYNTPCDSVCTRARNNGRSRYAQLTAEAKALPYPDKRNAIAANEESVFLKRDPNVQITLLP